MKTSELIRVLQSNGCYLVAHGKRHDRWFSPISEAIIIVPRHGSNEVPAGTLNEILKQAGLK